MSRSTIFCPRKPERTHVYRIIYALLAVMLLGCALVHIGLQRLTQSAYASERSPEFSHAEPMSIDLIAVNAAGQDFQVGQQIDWALSVSNRENAQSMTGAGPITVIDMLPEGLIDLRSSGVHWRTTLSALSSPATLTAVYDGPYPILSDVTLPPIVVSGIFTATAVPSIASSVLLEISGESSMLSPVSTHTVHIFAIKQPSIHPASTQLRTPSYPHTYLTPLADDTFYPNLPHSGY